MQSPGVDVVGLMRRGLGPALRRLLLGCAAAVMPALAMDAAAQRAAAPQPARLATYFDPLNFAWADGRWYVTGYAGVMAQNKLSSVVLFNASLQDDVLVGVGLGREFAAIGDALRFEWEANVAVHQDPFGTVGDFRFMLGARWTAFPWNASLPTTFAVMTGPSYLTGKSAYEVRKGQTERFTNGMAFELTFAPPDREDLRGVLRIHHRSPLFGEAGTASPSDAVTLGLQYRF